MTTTVHRAGAAAASAFSPYQESVADYWNREKNPVMRPARGRRGAGCRAPAIGCCRRILAGRDAAAEPQGALPRFLE